MSKKKLAVVIPVHKENLDKYEKLSYNQVLVKLKSHDIFIIGPENLNFEAYRNGPAQIIELDTSYFYSAQRHNQLLLSNDLYGKFTDYEYILYHQLDAFIFGDSIDYWCNQEYDYLGAPWLDTQLHYGNRILYYSLNNLPRVIGLLAKKMFGIKEHLPGNGGLSLRRTSSFIEALAKLEKVRKNWGSRNEDVFWSFLVPNHISTFKVAPFREALKFSFDMFPEKSYQLNNNQLPYGCHAWSHPENLEFWKPIVEKCMDAQLPE